MVRAADKMIFVRNLVIPKHAVDELSAFMDVERVKIANIYINPQS